MNFITSRLNRDNFWNLVVYFGILLTVFISAQTQSLLGLTCAFTITPYILTRFNRVKYLEEGSCVNSQGQDLSNRAFVHIVNIIVSSVILAACLNAFDFFDFLLEMPQQFKFTALIGCVIFWPFVYFMFKNYPISILFNAAAWSRNVTISSSGSINSSDPTLGHRPMTSSHSHSSSRNDFITSPVYSYMPQNIYHGSHNRRY